MSDRSEADRASNDLVERVARALARAAYSSGGMERITDPYTPDAEYWDNQATAALAVALEEAAKVAESCAPATQDTWSTELAERCDMVAAAIRALIPKENK